MCNAVEKRLLFKINTLSNLPIVWGGAHVLSVLCCYSEAFGKGWLLRTNSSFAAGVDQGISQLTQQSVNLGPSSPSKNVIPHRFYSAFFSRLVQVTHSNMVPWAFRCPSPCWAPFGPTEHSRQFETFTCRSLLRSTLCSSYQKIPFKIFIHELRDERGEWKTNTLIITSLSTEYRILHGKRKMR